MHKQRRFQSIWSHKQKYLNKGSLFKVWLAPSLVLGTLTFNQKVSPVESTLFHGGLSGFHSSAIVGKQSSVPAKSRSACQQEPSRHKYDPKEIKETRYMKLSETLGLSKKTEHQGPRSAFIPLLYLTSSMTLQNG